MALISRKNIALLTDTISVTIQKADYLPQFEKAIKDYGKQANIPGFRKGMVPIGHLKRLFGHDVFREQVLKAVDKHFSEYMANEKIAYMAQPLPAFNNDTLIESLDLKTPADYNFEFEIGLKEDFQIAPFDKADIKRNKVVVSTEMIEEEITRIQNQFAESEALAKIEDAVNPLITLGLVTEEIQDADAKDRNKVNIEFSHLTEHGQQQLSGKSTDSMLTLIPDTIFNETNQAGIFKKLGIAEDSKGLEKNFEIIHIEKRIPKPLNKDLFKLAIPGKEIETLEEFRNEVQLAIQNFWDNKAIGKIHDDLYHYLLENTQINFPEAFLKRWLKEEAKEPKTDSEVEEEFPGFLTSLRWNLISDKLLQENNISVSKEELKDYARATMLSYVGADLNMGYMQWMDGYVDKMLADENQVSRMYHELSSKKLFDWATEKLGNIPEIPVTKEELLATEHHHE